MGITYHYASLTKREWFSADALGGNSKFSGIGLSLTARAFDLLLVRSHERAATETVKPGRWSSDSIALIGDTEDDWLYYLKEFTDIEADVILMVYFSDGFERIASAAADDSGLFMELCHLVTTRQAMQLESHMKQSFGAKFLQRYKDLCSERSWFTPKNVAFPARS